jgi:hypothetical protein
MGTITGEVAKKKNRSVAVGQAAERLGSDVTI